MNLQELLRYEFLWVDTLCGLRDGTPEAQQTTHARSGMFIKSSGQARESIQTVFPGDSPRVILQPKFATTPGEIRDWQLQQAEAETQFEEAVFTPVSMIISAVPGERDLWEALKRANTAKQVRRVCSQSKRWLRPRLEFPDGGFMEYWPYRDVLYRAAERFCRAKLDQRYPGRDKRESGDYRRVEYLARVMAGLTMRIAPSTAVELLRKMKHADQCLCWRCNAKIAPRYPTSLASFLMQFGASFRNNLNRMAVE